MTIAMTPAVGRVLFACFLCVLCCGAAFAKGAVAPSEEVKKIAGDARDAFQAAEGNLTAAEDWVSHLTTHLGSLDAVDTTNVKKNATDLATAVKNATEEVKRAVKLLEDAKVSTLLSTELQDAKSLSTKLDTLSATAKDVEVDAAKVLETTKKDLKEKVEKMPTDLKDAKAAAHKTMEAVSKVAVEEKKPPTKPQEGLKDVSQAQDQKDQVEGDKDKKEKQPSDGAGDLVTQGPQGTKGNETHKNLSPQKNASSSSGKNTNPDGAHGGAITTCAAAPFLLLLTAVAYASVC